MFQNIKKTFQKRAIRWICLDSLIKNDLIQILINGLYLPVEWSLKSTCPNLPCLSFWSIIYIDICVMLLMHIQITRTMLVSRKSIRKQNLNLKEPQQAKNMEMSTTKCSPIYINVIFFITAFKKNAHFIYTHIQQSI